MVVGTEPAPVPASVPSADPQKDNGNNGKGGKGNQAWGFQNWNKNKGKGKGGGGYQNYNQGYGNHGYQNYNQGYGKSKGKGYQNYNQGYGKGGKTYDKDGNATSANPHAQRAVQEVRAANQVGTATETLKAPNQKTVKVEVSNELDDWKAAIPRVAADTREVTSDVQSKKNTSFDDYYLKRELQMGIFEKGYDAPSPIQEEAIPLALAGKDILARAKNGTGKTASFVIPMLENLEIPMAVPSGGVAIIQSVILVPTRELAIQTSGVVMELGKHMNVQCMAITGGVSLRNDILRLHQEVHVLVGTPGRILDLANKGICNLAQVKSCAMDEADKMLSVEFEPLIRNVLAFMPPKRQMMLFSATFPAEIVNFTNDVMPNAETINLMDTLTLKGVSQFYALLEEKEKVMCLATLFRKLQINQTIIFCNSVNRVEALARKVTEMGYSCFHIHAQMYQADRNRVFHDFRTGACRCLVTSDLFTRGIDIESVNVVVNFDFPRTAETYLHRIGRSGRFGHRGLAINLLTASDRYAMFRIKEQLGAQIEPVPQEVPLELYTG